MTQRQSPIGKGGEVILIQYHATFEIGPTPPFDRRETKYKSVDKGFLELVAEMAIFANVSKSWFWSPVSPLTVDSL